MKTRIEAKERARELAIGTGDVEAIRNKLADEGFGGLLERSELEGIVVESDCIRHLLPERPGRTLPRIMGLFAVIMGASAICLEAGGPAVSKYSPGAYGIAAVIFGVILIFKPSAAGTDL